MLVDDDVVVGGELWQDGLVVIDETGDLVLARKLVDSLTVFAKLLADFFRDILKMRLRPFVRLLQFIVSIILHW